jgi:bacteriorhodopsin
MCHQHLQVTSSSKRPVDWVMTACLVPEGLSTAAAAEEAGGLATMEVSVCFTVIGGVCLIAKLTHHQTKHWSLKHSHSN